MLNLFDLGNELLIWMGSVAAGLGVFTQIIRGSLNRFDFGDQFCLRNSTLACGAKWISETSSG